MARGPLPSMTLPTAVGSTIPPKLSPSRITPVILPVISMDCPARVNPVGQMGAMQKPSPIAISHRDALEPEKMIPRARMDRQLIKAVRMTCLGVKRVAAGMEIRRPTVKAAQNAEVR